MSYRILEMIEPRPELLDRAREVARYDSAYTALDAMKAATRRRGSPPNWYLVDHQSHILAEPYDMFEFIHDDQARPAP